MNQSFEETILRSTEPGQYEQVNLDNALHSLSLGITPLQQGDPRDSGLDAHNVLKCSGCGLPESQVPQKLSYCSICRMVQYCSVACQKEHWREQHKAVCSHLTDRTEAEGKAIVEQMIKGDVTSLLTIQRNDAVYAMAVRHGYFAAMEKLFGLEVGAGEIDHRGYTYSYTQDIIINTFKGKREVIDRFTCACPVRSKEYITSSPTAWDSLMDAMLYLAKVLTKEEFQSMRRRDEQEVGLAHRAARDAFVTINLALVHKKVAKAIFFGSRAVGKRSQDEAKEYALQTMLPKLKAFFCNGGEGFAPEHVDRNQTIQGNLYQFTAMLSYWYRTLEIDTENPNAFVDALQLNEIQETMFETLARPLGEGMIELGRSLSPEELRERSLKANREYQQKKASAKRGGAKKRGGKKKNRR